MLAQLCINSVSSGLPLLNWSELNIKQGLSKSAYRQGVGVGERWRFCQTSVSLEGESTWLRGTLTIENTTFAIWSMASSGCVSSPTLLAKGLLKFHYFIRSLAKEAKCGFFSLFLFSFKLCKHSNSAHYGNHILELDT